MRSILVCSSSLLTLLPSVLAAQEHYWMLSNLDIQKSTYSFDVQFDINFDHNNDPAPHPEGPFNTHCAGDIGKSNPCADTSVVVEQSTNPDTQMMTLYIVHQGWNAWVERSGPGAPWGAEVEAVASWLPTIVPGKIRRDPLAIREAEPLEEMYSNDYDDEDASVLGEEDHSLAERGFVDSDFPEADGHQVLTVDGKPVAKRDGEVEDLDVNVDVDALVEDGHPLEDRYIIPGHSLETSHSNLHYGNGHKLKERNVVGNHLHKGPPTAENPYVEHSEGKRDVEDENEDEDFDVLGEEAHVLEDRSIGMVPGGDPDYIIVRPKDKQPGGKRDVEDENEDEIEDIDVLGEDGHSLEDRAYKYGNGYDRNPSPGTPRKLRMKRGVAQQLDDRTPDSARSNTEVESENTDVFEEDGYLLEDRDGKPNDSYDWDTSPGSSPISRIKRGLPLKPTQDGSRYYTGHEKRLPYRTGRDNVYQG